MAQQLSIGKYLFDVHIEVVVEDEEAILMRATEYHSKDIFEFKQNKKIITSMNWPNKSLDSVKTFIESALFNPEDGMSVNLGFIKFQGMQQNNQNDNDDDIKLSDTYSDDDILIINVKFINKWFNNSWTINLKQAKQDEIARLKSIITDLRNDLKETKQRIDKDGVPKGTIIMWSGSRYNIPNGWKICDGSNKTPDLTDKFVMAGGSYHSAYDIGDDGGQKSHKHAVNIGDTHLTIGQIPNHSHEILFAQMKRYTGGSTSNTQAFGNSNITSGSGNKGNTTYRTPGTGSGYGHKHSAYCNMTNNMPPYMVLAFIMKM